MCVKPNKMKGINRPITNATSTWHVCYDLCSLSFSYLVWFSQFIPVQYVF